MKEFTLKEVLFRRMITFQKIALEDFSLIQKDLPYMICQSIGQALAKV